MRTSERVPDRQISAVKQPTAVLRLKYDRAPAHAAADACRLDATRIAELRCELVKAAVGKEISGFFVSHALMDSMRVTEG